MTTVQLEARKRPLWLSVLIFTAVLLLLAAGAAIWIWNIWIAHTASLWTDIMGALFVVLGVIIAFLQLSNVIFPPPDPVTSRVYRVNELKHAELRAELKQGVTPFAIPASLK